MLEKYDISIVTLGCKVNQVESSEIARMLSCFRITQELVVADYYIINTCSVTNVADKKSRQVISKARRLNKDAKIFVVGCLVAYDSKSLLDVVVCNKTQVAQILLNELGERKKEGSVEQRTRTFINIQDGCDRYCSYCIVPYLRGKSVSVPLEVVVEKAKTSATNEIVFTGICISDYKPSLEKLVDSVKDIKARKRFGSLSVEVISLELLEKMKAANFCEHFHLSIQSGSDTVLKRMNRNYTGADILEKVELIRKVFPDSSIIVDIICGFPGETEQEFNQTLKVFKKANFSFAHIFPYSERKGTAATGLPQVEIPIRKQRAKILTEIAKTQHKKFIIRQSGKPQEVLVEKDLTGYTRNYIKLKNLPFNKVGQLFETTID